MKLTIKEKIIPLFLDKFKVLYIIKKLKQKIYHNKLKKLISQKKTTLKSTKIKRITIKNKLKVL